MTDTRQVLEEAWNAIPMAEGIYEVSSLGRVRSVKTGKIFNPSTPRDNRTYMAVSLHLPSGRVRRSVHRLVAEAFIPKPDGATMVRHLNGDNADNRASNLAWGTAKNNSEDRKRHGRTASGHRHGMWGATSVQGVHNGFARLNDEVICEIRKLEGHLSQRKIAAKFQIHQSTVYRILRRKAWRHVSDHPALAIAQAALRAKEAGDVHQTPA